MPIFCVHIKKSCMRFVAHKTMWRGLSSWWCVECIRYFIIFFFARRPKYENTVTFMNFIFFLHLWGSTFRDKMWAKWRRCKIYDFVSGEKLYVNSYSSRISFDVLCCSNLWSFLSPLENYSQKYSWDKTEMKYSMRPDGIDEYFFPTFSQSEAEQYNNARGF